MTHFTDSCKSQGIHDCIRWYVRHLIESPLFSESQLHIWRLGISKFNLLTPHFKNLLTPHFELSSNGSIVTRCQPRNQGMAVRITFICVKASCCAEHFCFESYTSWTGCNIIYMVMDYAQSAAINFMNGYPVTGTPHLLAPDIHSSVLPG